MSNNNSLKEIDEKTKLKVFRAIDKSDRMSPQDIFLLLTIGRKDKSGDFTPGAELHPWQVIMVMMISILSKPEYEHIRNRFDFLFHMSYDEFTIMMDEYDAIVGPKHLAKFIDDRITNH